MKKINLKAKKYWDIQAVCNQDLLAIGAVLSASGTNWDGVETQLETGEVIVNTIRVWSNKKTAAKLQSLISGMSEVGIFKGSVSMEVYPHR